MSFPLNPSLAQQVTIGGRTWQWNGRAWAFVPSPDESGGSGGSFNPSDEIYADIARFSLMGATGAAGGIEGGATPFGWTISGLNGANLPFVSGFLANRRRLDAYNAGVGWGARVNPTVLSVKVGGNKLGGFLVVCDMTYSTSTSNGPLFIGVSDYPAAFAPIEDHGYNYIGFMRQQTPANYQVATRVGGPAGPWVLVDTGIGIGAKDGSVVRRFVVHCIGDSVDFRIWKLNSTNNQFDILEYETNVSTGLPTNFGGMSPTFGGPSSSPSDSIFISRFSGWVAL